MPGSRLLVAYVNQIFCSGECAFKFGSSILSSKWSRCIDNSQAINFACW